MNSQTTISIYLSLLIRSNFFYFTVHAEDIQFNPRFIFVSSTSHSAKESYLYSLYAIDDRAVDSVSKNHYHTTGFEKLYESSENFINASSVILANRPLCCLLSVKHLEAVLGTQHTRRYSSSLLIRIVS